MLVMFRVKYSLDLLNITSHLGDCLPCSNCLTSLSWCHSTSRQLSQTCSYWHSKCQTQRKIPTPSSHIQKKIVCLTKSDQCKWVGYICSTSQHKMSIPPRHCFHFICRWDEAWAALGFPPVTETLFHTKFTSLWERVRIAIAYLILQQSTTRKGEFWIHP